MTFEEIIKFATKQNTQVLHYESLNHRFAKVIHCKKEYYFTYEEGTELMKYLGLN